MYLKFDEIVPIVFILCKKMITRNETACLTPWSCCYVPVESKGVYYALRGGNHVMHFKQPHWKKLVRGAIKDLTVAYFRTYNFLSCNLVCTFGGFMHPYQMIEANYICPACLFVCLLTPLMAFVVTFEM